MKFRLLLLALCALLVTPASAFTAGYARLEPTVLAKNADGKYALERVIEVPGGSKAELYKRVKAWVLANIKATDIATTFDNVSFDAIAATTVLTIPDHKSSGHINQTMNFKMAIQFKDGKIRLLLNNFVYYVFRENVRSETRGAFETVEVIPKIARDVSQKVDEIIPALVANVERAAQGADTSNW